jgi:CHAT domain-containing protein/Tfp pilus assembly protein PilF
LRASFAKATAIKELFTMAVGRLITLRNAAVLGGAILCLTLARQAAPQTRPAESAQPAPAAAPWQRVLTGADAKQAAELGEQIAKLYQDGQYAEAQEPAQRLLTLRTRVQGADHWQTGDARRELEDLRRLEHLPADQRAQLRESDELNGRVYRLWQAGKFKEALPLAQKALAIRRQLLGKDQSKLSVSLFNLGAQYQGLDDYAAAQACYEQALAIRRRTLGEDHPATAQSYHNLALTLYSRGKYAEAEPLFQKALATCRRTRGEDSPETAITYNGVAQNLQARGRYGEAETQYRKALAIYQKTLGENHRDTASVTNNLAANLYAQGKYAEAERLHRQALAIRREALGEAHPFTAESYANLAAALNGQGKYAEAEKLYDKALDIRQKRFGAEHPLIASSYNGLARNLDDQGRYAEAEKPYRQALDIHRRALGKEHPLTALSYNNLAVNLDSQGKYAQAEPLHRQALILRQKLLGEDHSETATSYNNLASNLHYQGRDFEAEPLYQKALASLRKALGDDHLLVGSSYSNVAANLDEQGKHREAEPLRQEALAIHRKALGADHPLTARSYSGVAFNLDAQGKYAEAESLYRRVLAIRRKALGEDHPDTALSYSNLAFNLGAQGKHTEAEPLYRRALAIRRKTLGEGHPDTASSYHNLAFSLYLRGEYAAAEGLWQTAAEVFESARLAVSFSGLDRAAFAAEHSPLPGLTACLVRAGKATEAWQAWEANLARGLFDDLSARLARPLTKQERQRQQELVGRLQRLDKQITTLAQPRFASDLHRQQRDKLQEQREATVADLTQFEAELAKTHGPAAGQVYALARIQAELPADAALVGWLDIPGRPQAADPNGEHWACIVRQSGEPLWVKLPGQGPKNAWTAADDQLPGKVRASLMRKPSDATVKWLAGTGPLYAQRLAVLAKHLSATADLPAVRHLIILPSRSMAGIPVEALIEARTDKQYPYIISYAPSGTLFAWLQEKRKEARSQDHKAGHPRLLALGDPVFRASDAAGEPVRGQPFGRLHGTRREVEAIAGLFDQADKLLGSQASEQQLDHLATSGRLKDYRFLHLATHGVLHPHSTLQSALILAQDDLPDPLQQVLTGKQAYDGRLTAAQILRTWKLDAELVTLSACQTGLGQYQGGEGYLGFAQALFLAGGRSLVLSLWRVDDNATALLMIRFYQNLLGERPGLDKPLPKAEALQEAKAWLRTLTVRDVEHQLAVLPRGEEREKPAAPVPAAVHPYGHPYYWAAFILIGDPH